MKNEKFDEITMKENVESKQVLIKYQQALKNTRIYITIPLTTLAVFVFCFIISVSLRDYSTIVVFFYFSIIAFASLLVCKVIRAEKVSFYKNLYVIARKNDAIRHDEKVRYLERKRLEQKYDNSFNSKNIKETLSYPDKLDD